MKKSGSADILVAFHNSQGIHAQGTLVDLNRHTLVFEVYNPYTVVQLSEVLNSVRIRRGGRDTYSGKAVVTNLVNTGLMLIVSASLMDPWSDLIELTPGPQLRDEITRFVADWSDSNQQLSPPFKGAVTDLRHFLEELYRWLEHGETVADISENGASPDLVNAFVQDVDTAVAPSLDGLYRNFEHAAGELPRKSAAVHSAFAQRELHPLMMCSPFIHRSFAKPLGYAGDYQIVNMMLGDPFQGKSTFAKVINASALRAVAPRAHRNRIQRLSHTLIQETRRITELGRDFRILNVGCGPADELQEFIRHSWIADRVEIELMDFNEETLRFTESKISELLQQTRRKTRVKYTHRSINDLVKDAAAMSTTPEPRFDLVYCAGLFDYFADSTCQCLMQLFYALTAPGGLVFATNGTPDHSSVSFMKYVLEWNLILRDAHQMLELAPKEGHRETSLDDSRVNVFLEVRKPGHSR